MSTVSDFPTLGQATATTGTNAQATTATVTTGTGTNTATGTGTQATTQTDSTATTASVITNAPNLSSGISKLTDLPTLSGYYSYPAPTVPPTNNAPYMQATSLPQNFVFIVVGAVIAFLTLCIVAWRFIAAWSINRNIKRDGTEAAYMPLYDQKKKPTKTTESSHDMADLSALPKSFGGSVPSLFFSPTAQVAKQSTMPRPPSQHLPSGHYRDGSK